MIWKQLPSLAFGNNWETNAGEFPEVTATAGGCSDCWKLRRVASKARNMTENKLSILIVIFSIQLPDRKKYSLLRDKHFCEDSRIHYLC